MSFAVRSATRLVRQRTPPSYISKRSMSSHSDPAHDAEESLKWRNVTAVAYVACIAFGIYTFSGAQHHAPHERPAYPYLHIRSKEFPWGPCGLFEWDCQKEQRAIANASK